MGEGGSDTATVEVDDASALAAREDDAPVESVAALWVEQAETLQEIEGIALRREMTAQAPARSIADPQFFDQSRIAQSSLLEDSAVPRGSVRVAADRKSRLARARRQSRLEECFAARGKQHFGERTDDGTTGQSE